MGSSSSTYILYCMRDRILPLQGALVLYTVREQCSIMVVLYILYSTVVYSMMKMQYFLTVIYYRR